MVGSANGRSITALSNAFPQNESRTSTQAITVPTTALIATTATDKPRVTLSEATACGLVTASQNASQPPSVERQVRAASGRSTIRLR
jgi:hypothetical protein